MDLLGLLQLGYQGRHLMMPEPSDAPQLSAWLSARGDFESRACRLAFETGLREQARVRSALSVRVQPGNLPPRFENQELVLGLAAALVFLSSAFRILLEDNARDREFVLAVARPEWRNRLLEMEDKGWLQFEHGGGVTRMEETLNAIRRDPPERHGAWVLFDSDALAPGRPSDKALRLRRRCGGDIAFHCLERRSIENYLPLLALDHWAAYLAGDRDGRTRAVRAFRSMTPSCRFYYNLKHGFHGDADRTDRDNVGSLYDDLDEAARQALEHGFGHKIADLFAWHTSSNWEWWMDAGQEREEGDRMTQELFSRL